MNIRALTVLAFLGIVSPAVCLAAYDQAYVGEQITYRAKYEDTFVHLARDYNLGFTELRAANPYVDPWVPGAGKKLIMPTRHLLPDAPYEGVVINLPEMRLYAFVNGEEAPTTFPIGVGREGLNTPTGSTKIVRKKEGPVWRPTPRMRKEDPELPAAVYPGPENPLGTHALYLGWPQYLIHGTNRPFGIGRRISSGCIRMYPETIIKLYDMIPVGTKVTVVDQPIKVGWIDDRLYLEAHANIEQSVEMEETGVISAPKLNDEDMARIIKVAGEDKGRIRWSAVRLAVKERKGIPVEIARRSGASDDVAVVEEGEEQAVDMPDAEEIENALKEVYGPEEGQDESAPYEEADYNSNSTLDERDPYRTVNQ
jgi:L,D-transpeptidase ErfK/SrfK